MKPDPHNRFYRFFSWSRTREESGTGSGTGSGKHHGVQSSANPPTAAISKMSAWFLPRFFEVAAKAFKFLRNSAEFAAVYALLILVRVIPMAGIRVLARVIARVAFLLLRRRRHIAVENIQLALDLPSDRALEIARQSLLGFAMTALPEVAKLRRSLIAKHASGWLQANYPGAVPLFVQARQLHDEYGGCVFVTPHLGNWELLPYAAAVNGINLAVLIRRLDNPMLEDLLDRHRRATGQHFVSRRNGLLSLKNHLARGRSVAILPDQSTVGGLTVDFFGRPATTTPLPALLAVRHQRPIVVVACLRSAQHGFIGHVGEPILPRDTDDERPEIERLTRLMTADLEQLIRRYPEQYLWMHDRWKVY